jgi:VIT1/CCC1 family predicted Fe2+/Mn2+ transporter
VRTDRHTAAALAAAVFRPYHLPAPLLASLATHLSRSPAQLEDFLMRFHHGQPPPAAHRAYASALTIAAAYFLGGLVPLLPYFFVREGEIGRAFAWSVAVMVVALAAFGYGKTGAVRGWHGRVAVWEAVKGAGQMVLVGGVAAGCAMGLVKGLAG